MVDRQVNMGTTLDLLWLAKFGIDAARHDPDRKLIPPMALERQKQMVAHMGSVPTGTSAIRWPRPRAAPRRSKSIRC